MCKFYRQSTMEYDVNVFMPLLIPDVLCAQEILLAEGQQYVYTLLAAVWSYTL